MSIRKLRSRVAVRYQSRVETADIEEGDGLIVGAGTFTDALASDPRIARWLVPTLSCAFQGTDSSTLEPTVRSLLLVRVAIIERAPYWRRRWEEAARSLGIEQDVLTLLSSDEWELAPILVGRERAGVLWADRVARRLARRDRVAYEEVSEWFDADEFVELTLVASLASMAVRITNALRIPPDGTPGLAPTTRPVMTSSLRAWRRTMLEDLPVQGG